MDRTAALAGMSKRTLYAVYPDRGALLTALVDSMFDALAADVEPVLDDAASRPAWAFQQVLALTSKHLAVVGPKQAELRLRDPDLWVHVVERRRRTVLAPLEEILGLAADQGLINAAVRPEVAVHVIPSLIEAIAQSPLLTEQQLTVAAVVDLLAELISNGLFVTDDPGDVP